MFTAHSLLEEYLERLNSQSYLQKMNISQSYTRLYPLLLGSSRQRTQFLTSFSSNHMSAKGSTAALKSFSTDEKDLENNPYFKKYADKIQKLERSNPEEYKARLKALASLHAQPSDAPSSDKNAKKDFKSRDETPVESVPSNKGLDSILNVEKVNALSKEEIRDLWIQHYADKDAVCAVIDSQAYVIIQTIATSFPVFVYPIPRQDGYEMFVGQFSNNEFHFTSLVNYQCHQANAPSQLTLKHYTELQDEKGIVLMAGMVMDDAISVTDAQLLSYLIQHFCNEHPNLMKEFNMSPNTFNINSVIDAMDGALISQAGKLNKK